MTKQVMLRVSLQTQMVFDAFRWRMLYSAFVVYLLNIQVLRAPEKLDPTFPMMQLDGISCQPL